MLPGKNNVHAACEEKRWRQHKKEKFLFCILAGLKSRRRAHAMALTTYAQTSCSKAVRSRLGKSPPGLSYQASKAVIV